MLHAAKNFLQNNCYTFNHTLEALIHYLVKPCIMYTQFHSHIYQILHTYLVT